MDTVASSTGSRSCGTGSPVARRLSTHPSRASRALASASYLLWPQVWPPGIAGTEASQLPSSSCRSTTLYRIIETYALSLKSSMLMPASLKISAWVPIGNIRLPCTGTESVTRGEPGFS